MARDLTPYLNDELRLLFSFPFKTFHCWAEPSELVLGAESAFPRLPDFWIWQSFCSYQHLPLQYWPLEQQVAKSEFDNRNSNVDIFLQNSSVVKRPTPIQWLMLLAFSPLGEYWTLEGVKAWIVSIQVHMLSPNPQWKSKRVPEKTSISALLTMPKPLTVWITINCGKFWKRWEYQTTWPASWETCMQVRKQQLELDMEQQTGSK